MSHRNAGTQSRLRRFVSTAAVVVGTLIAGLSVAAPVQAHTLTVSSAKGEVARYADKKIRSVNNDYIHYDGIRCTSLYPHQLECRVGFDNRASKPTSRFACAERLLVYYKAHSEVSQRTPLIFLKYLTHEC